MTQPSSMSRGYAERDDAREPALDRLFADLGDALRRLRTRGCEGARVGDDVAARAAALRGVPDLRQLPQLRYRLRRDGCTRELAVECFAVYHAIVEQLGMRPEPGVTHAAYAMMSGGVAQLASVSGRRQALAMAAWTLALSGVPVHVLAAGDAMANEIAALLKPIGKASGIEIAAIAAADDARARRQAYRAGIVCANAREIGHDYLRDRHALGAQARTLPGLIERLAADPGSRKEPLLPGLHCALVADADVLMMDDAHIPLMLAADAQQPELRLVYEQALEFARTLVPGVQFALEESGARLTGEGRGRLARLVASLGGVWRADQGREALVEAALDALHRLERDRDYRVERDAVRFPPSAPEEGQDEAEARAMRQRMVEIKEGCRLSGVREVLARLSYPRFLRRYVRLAAVCEDATGLARDFRALYRLPVARATEPARHDFSVRVFADARVRDAALVEAIRQAAGGGATAVVAVRTPKQAQAVAGVLADAGLEPSIASGEAAGTGAAGKPVLVLYPAHRSLDARAWSSSSMHLVVAELHDAGRHVQQLCRIFAPAACTVMLALEDDGFAAALGALLPALKLRYRKAEEASGADARRLYAHAQRNLERAGSLARLDLIARDQQLSDALAFSGQRD